MNATITYRKSTNVAHIDLRETGVDEPVEVQEIGEALGFPGLIMVRFNPETGESFGFTVQRWSYVRRRVMWRYRTLKAKEALDRLIQKAMELWKPAEHRLLLNSR
jgi:hypothetical protein